MEYNVEFRLLAGGLHVEVYHDCVRHRAFALLPINAKGWTVTQVEPLTLTPSILCHACKLHGYIRDGEWISC